MYEYSIYAEKYENISFFLPICRLEVQSLQALPIGPLHPIAASPILQCIFLAKRFALEIKFLSKMLLFQ